MRAPILLVRIVLLATAIAAGACGRVPVSAGGAPAAAPVASAPATVSAGPIGTAGDGELILDVRELI